MHLTDDASKHYQTIDVTIAKWEMISICPHQNSNMELEDEAQPDLPPKEQKAKSGTYTFRLRVALRSSASTRQSTDDEEEDMRTKKRGVKRAEDNGQAKRMRRVKFEGEHEERAVTQPSPPEERGSDSAEDGPDSFLAKREQNIKANKAMVYHKHIQHRTIRKLIDLFFFFILNTHCQQPKLERSFAVGN